MLFPFKSLREKAIFVRYESQCFWVSRRNLPQLQRLESSVPLQNTLSAVSNHRQTCKQISFHVPKQGEQHSQNDH